MKKVYLLILAFASNFLTLNPASAQCTTANINWDNLDYLQRNNANYSAYITTTMFASVIQTQRFAIGTNRLTIATNYASASILGENTTHTGETGSFGAGADASFSGNGTFTFTFDTVVSNVQFSLYDIDRGVTATVTALDGTGASINTVTLSPAVATWGTSAFTPNPVTSTTTSVGAAPMVTANGSSYGNTSSTATLNISVPAAVKSITVTIATNTTDPTFWLSDISACVYRNFPTNYYAISQPFTGQPAWILAVHDQNTIYMVDPATGRAVSLFTDNSPRVGEINNIAYDPYNHHLYYSIDGLERCASYGLGPNGPPDSVRYIRRYDFDTETYTEIIDTLYNAPWNVPTFTQGLETGGAAFYNGSLFIGVEGKNSSNNSGREAIVWRIDFDGSYNPIQACQVFAAPGDNGSGTATHDWGDIIMKDGVLYDFNSMGSGASILGQFNLVNMQTNVVSNVYTGLSNSNKPRQVGQQWNGNLCWLHDSIATYDGTNVVTGKLRIVAAARSTTWVLGAGDAAEAFRPKADFGDAPSTYDADPMAPALHERDSALYLGGAAFLSNWDWEWNKQTSTNATGDGDDEDGLAFVPMMAPIGGGYNAQVSVYNNTGANATIIAWIDLNGDGDFDASEVNSAPITVPSSSSNQLFWLYWPTTTNTFTHGDSTFLRIRVTSAANSMTSSNATGYFADGEVEDYVVRIDNFPLSVNLLAFDAKAINTTTARLIWKTTGEELFYGFYVERSVDGVNWNALGFVNASGGKPSSVNDYVYNDLQAVKGKSYYRLKMVNTGGQFSYSEVRVIVIKDIAEQVTVMPNPARHHATVYINSNISENATIILTDMQGRQLKKQIYRLTNGGNTVALDNLDRLPDGTYIVQLITSQGIISRKLIIDRNF